MPKDGLSPYEQGTAPRFYSVPPLVAIMAQRPRRGGPELFPAIHERTARELCSEKSRDLRLIKVYYSHGLANPNNTSAA
jgi:hypothetical protein